MAFKGQQALLWWCGFFLLQMSRHLTFDDFYGLSYDLLPMQLCRNKLKNSCTPISDIEVGNNVAKEPLSSIRLKVKRIQI